MVFDAGNLRGPADQVDVICIAGSGFTSVGSDTSVISADETINWPKGIEHGLWTTESTMETLMIEHHGH